jgi:hypothetical protein
MSLVEEYRNWCEYDQLDGQTIEEGEKLRVTFADGVTRKIVAHVVKSSYNILEPSGETCIPTSSAFATTEMWGMTVRIRLVGLEAKRVKE